MDTSTASIENLSAEANHRIANNLASLSSIVRLQVGAVAGASRSFTAAEVCVMLRDVGARIEVTARLHKFLANAAGSDGIELGSFLREICGMIASFAPKGATVLTFECECRTLTAANVALPIGFVVAELVTNAIKYAHPAGLPVKLSIACGTDENGMLLVEVADDGVGFPDDFDPNTDGGLGFRLIRALASSIQAGLQFDHDSLGVRCRLMRQSIH